ncbi:MAG TPA: endonuclease/exonuclease/phosphatase family protein, partial [Acidimicrobiia bacterium]
MTRLMAAEFRVMTANLLHEHCDARAFARLIEELRPDVVLTQELGPEPARVLSEVYPHHLLRPSLDFTGNGLATSLEVEFDDDIPMPGRDGIAARLTVGGQIVRLAGIHLLNPLNFPWWVSARGRRRQVEGLVEWLDQGDGPVVVAGDCNASPAWPAYRLLAGNFTDVVAERATSDGTRPQPTWGWRPGWPRMLRIDHVFGREVVAKAVTVRAVRGSDHDALVVDLAVA